MSVPDGAACWICLDEGPDVYGRPLVRDCSCRGDSAGFAHLSCLVQYAKQKTIAHEEKKGVDDMDYYRQPWQICFHCEQLYQGQLSLDMSEAFVSFAKEKYDYPGNDSNDKLKVIDALRIKIDSTTEVIRGCHNDKSLEVTKESDIKEVLDRVEHLKKSTNMASWIHAPKESPMYRNYKLIRQHYEASTYVSWGALYSNRKTKDNFCIALKHYKKALTIFKILDAKDEAQFVEGHIAAVKVSMKSDWQEGDGDVGKTVLHLRNNYHYDRKNFGEDSDQTIRAGLNYADALGNVCHCRIEAERLTIKLAARSRRVHGPEHEITKFAELELERCKTRLVGILSSPPDFKQFQLLRYEDGRANCLVKGPLTLPRNARVEEIFTIPSSRIFPGLGCPVTCHGLKSAPGLNGKLGDVRCVSSEKEVRCAVHFEDKRLKPAAVKPENLWVVIELPQKEIK